MGDDSLVLTWDEIVDSCKLVYRLQTNHKEFKDHVLQIIYLS